MRSRLFATRKAAIVLGLIVSQPLAFAQPQSGASQDRLLPDFFSLKGATSYAWQAEETPQASQMLNCRPSGAQSDGTQPADTRQKHFLDKEEQRSRPRSFGISIDLQDPLSIEALN
ncbi:hypothetical protein QIW53_13940 [Pseudomonas fluorescens]|uniref:hypothetical protein n=1 Tax=Pseudomonas fluorescens TaxID=294 RepID=UPI00352696E9